MSFSSRELPGSGAEQSRTILIGTLFQGTTDASNPRKVSKPTKVEGTDTERAWIIRASILYNIRSCF